MIGFSAIGHVIRDGVPALGQTWLARATGGLAVTAGCLVLFSWPTALVLGLAVYAGFYTDMQHGEANKGDWRAGVISGCTSLAPLAAAAAGLHMSLWWLGVVATGLIKPLVWQFAWWLDPGRLLNVVPMWAMPLTHPTRVAAIIWGAWVGVLVTIIAIGG